MTEESVSDWQTVRFLLNSSLTISAVMRPPSASVENSGESNCKFKQKFSVIV